MPLNAGTRIGPYEIVAPLGAGGMGEVFRARDARLGRDVAIKALPAAFAQDPERLARFEREAKLLASLSHANVAGIFGIEEAEGARYLVLEFVDGESLEARLRRGALPLDEAIDVAKQIAAGVEAAHDAGVIHRDLKPGNVMLTPAGAVKVLDFGLAKGGATRGASGSDPNLSASPTMTALAGTGMGVILGTAAYMSPEQARGRTLDRRTDIWSFGCVLYEMLTGHRVYDGETVSDMVARILEREPDWAALPANTPPRLRALLQRCLIKDARQRLRDIGDARLELEAIAAGDRGDAPVAASAAAPATRGVPLWAFATALLAAVAALVWAFGPWHATHGAVPLVRFTIDAPPQMHLATPAEPEVSPDGSMIAFIAQDSADVTHACVRPLDGTDVRVLASTEGASLPFWAPDSRALGFFARGKLRRVGIDGSAPIDLCAAPDGRGGCWAGNGTILFAPDNQGGLYRVADNGGAPTPLSTPDSTRHERGHRYPQLLPDGKHFLYVATSTVGGPVTFVGSLSGEKPVELGRFDSIARWIGEGWVLFIERYSPASARLLAKRFDPATRRISGDAQLVLDRANSDNIGYVNASAGAGGVLVSQHWDPDRNEFRRYDRHGRDAGLVLPSRPSLVAQLSPDGRRVAFASLSPPGLFVHDIASGVDTRLTFENTLISYPVWAPDGRHIAYGRFELSRGWEIRLKSADGSGPDSSLFHGPGLFSIPQSFTPDGSALIAECTDASGGFALWSIPLTSAGRPERLQSSGGPANNDAVSPDGKWIASVRTVEDKHTLVVQPLPLTGSQYEVSIDRTVAAYWEPDGRGLVAVKETGDVVSVPVSTSAGFQQGAITTLFRLLPRQQVLGIDRTTGDLFVMNPVEATDPSRLDVVIGWTELLKRK